MAIDRFSLDDTDDSDYIALEVEFIEDDVIMFIVVDKTKRDNKERAVISVVYSDLVSGIAQLRRPTPAPADVCPKCGGWLKGGECENCILP